MLAPENGANTDVPTGRLLICGRMGTSGGNSTRSYVRVSASNADDNQDFPACVETRLATEAVVCGSLGCRETGGLLTVELPGKERVLCPDCAAVFVEQEADHA